LSKRDGAAPLHVLDLDCDDVMNQQGVQTEEAVEIETTRPKRKVTIPKRLEDYVR
jgi:hypothetical protein